jgi:hypothetical protein
VRLEVLHDSQNRQIISIKGINKPIFLMETYCIFFTVGTEYLNSLILSCPVVVHNNLRSLEPSRHTVDSTTNTNISLVQSVFIVLHAS